MTLLQAISYWISTKICVELTKAKKWTLTAQWLSQQVALKNSLWISKQCLRRTRTTARKSHPWPKCQALSSSSQPRSLTKLNTQSTRLQQATPSYCKTSVTAENRQLTIAEWIRRLQQLLLARLVTNASPWKHSQNKTQQIRWVSQPISLPLRCRRRTNEWTTSCLSVQQISIEKLIQVLTQETLQIHHWINRYCRLIDTIWSQMCSSRRPSTQAEIGIWIVLFCQTTELWIEILW